MESSRSNLLLVIIFTIVALVAISVMVWVHNATDIMSNNIKGINNQDNYSSHTCTAEEKRAEICTMEYAPVCGNDNRTYGNKCTACAAKIESWVQGEC